VRHTDGRPERVRTARRELHAQAVARGASARAARPSQLAGRGRDVRARAQGECEANPRYMVGDEGQVDHWGFCRLACAACVPDAPAGAPRPVPAPSPGGALTLRSCDPGRPCRSGRGDVCTWCVALLYVSNHSLHTKVCGLGCPACMGARSMVSKGS